MIEHFGVLYDYASTRKLVIDESQYTLLAEYLHQLQQWNERLNLTAITEPVAMVHKHALDALTYLPLFPKAPGSLIDIGSGGGIPGVILAIMWPATQVTLVESIAKKCTFLAHIRTHLALDNLQVVSERAEVLGQDPAYRAQFDVATARAVAELRVLVEYLLPLVRLGGKVYTPKGPEPQAEVDAAAHAIQVLGGHLRDVIPITAPGLEPRTMVRIVKYRATPGAFPRTIGVPSKKPL